MLHLKYGEKSKAKEIALQAVNDGKNQVLPLAIYIHILESMGDQSESEKQFRILQNQSSLIDIEFSPFTRVLPIAKRLGETENWRTNKSWRGEDFGDNKPEKLNHLGPLVYQPPSAPGFDLLCEDGTRVSLESFSGKPVLLIFYLGHNCEHCVEQLNNISPFAKEFENSGIEIVAVGPEKLSELAKAHNLCSSGEEGFPFKLYSDLESGSFKDYRSYDDFEGMPLHGVFLIDKSSKLRWMDVGPEPFQDIKFLLRESKRLLSM